MHLRRIPRVVARSLGIADLGEKKLLLAIARIPPPNVDLSALVRRRPIDRKAQPVARMQE
jgi:hypothetical protein